MENETGHFHLHMKPPWRRAKALASSCVNKQKMVFSDHAQMRQIICFHPNAFNAFSASAPDSWGLILTTQRI